MQVNAPFYVRNIRDRLVPAKFMVGQDGQYVTNPNATPNTISRYSNRYYNADGSEIRNANPGNYLVVPHNYMLGHAIQFASDVNNAASYGVSPNTMMVAAFVGPGSQNLQRTYRNARRLNDLCRSFGSDVSRRGVFPSWACIGVNGIWPHCRAGSRQSIRSSCSRRKLGKWQIKLQASLGQQCAQYELDCRGSGL